MKTLYVHGIGENNSIDGKIVNYHPIGNQSSSIRKVSVRKLY